MKITKTQLKKIIKEELEEIDESLTRGYESPERGPPELTMMKDMRATLEMALDAALKPIVSRLDALDGGQSENQ